jgi:hypothetical protein
MGIEQISNYAPYVKYQFRISYGVGFLSSPTLTDLNTRTFHLKTT